MATLNIGGKRVKVDDAFLSMTPEQQQQTVEEIAGQLGAAPDDPMANASAMSQSIQGGPGPRQQPPVDLGTATAATISGFVNGIPIAGPLLQGASDAIIAGGQMGVDALTGKPDGADFQRRMEVQQANRQNLRERAPISDIAGNLGGGIATFGVGGASKVGAEILGMSGKFLPRVINSMRSGATISAGDTAARGGSAEEMLINAAKGGALDAAVPIVGAGVKQTLGAAGRVLQPTVGAMRDATGEAARRLGIAATRDRRANPGMVMNQTDEAVARQSGVPVINADRGGETVRALSRSVANQSPEARAIIDKTASDRFSGQAGRAVETMRRIAGGSVDDLGYQNRIQEAARFVNRPAYDAAFNAPNAQAVWNQPIKELMQSDTFRAAINAAEKRGTDRAAVAGFKAVRNPFEFRADGSVTLKTNADGSRALPSLQFWDQVKRNIDGMIGTAKRQGDNTLLADLTAIKQKLTGALDAAVPQYAKARAGAASFFGAEDALEAGKKFATATRAVPEARAAFAKLKPAEQEAFRTGFASEVIDKIKDARFRANVIDGAFGTPAKREMMEIVFGKGKARELEAYIRVEELADKLRGALGNSTTARQLVELGIGAGSGAIITGGDWKGAIAGAGVAKGVRFANQKVNDKVMEEIARMLTSGDEALMKKAVFQASLSPMWMDGLEAWGKLLSPVSRGTTHEMIAGPQRPLEITVGSGVR